jgi:integrase
MREPVRRRKGEILTPEEFISLLDAAAELDARAFKSVTLEQAREVRRLRVELNLSWKRIAERLGIAPATAIHLDRQLDRTLSASGGVRRAIVATLGLAGLRVSELCEFDVQHIHLTAGKIQVRESKTDAGVRAVDIRSRLLEELKAYRSASDQTDMTAPAFPTRTGGRRDKDNVGGRVLYPVVRRTNERRTERGQPPVLAHVTPHTLRRTYISFMLAAGFDLPYVQEQVGHQDPSTTLKIYAQAIRRPDRDRLRAEMRELLGEKSRTTARESARKGPITYHEAKRPRPRSDEPFG